MVASAAAAVTAAAAAAQPGNDSGPPRPSNDAEAATAAAVAAAIAAGPRFGRDSDHEDEDEQDGRAAAGTTSKDDDEDDAFVLPLGQVLMRQATRAATAVPTYGPSSPSPGIRLLSDDSAADFLCFPDDVLGREGCRLQDGEELILVRRGVAVGRRMVVGFMSCGYVTIASNRRGGTVGARAMSRLGLTCIERR